MSYRNRKKSTIVCVIVLIIVFCTMFSIVQNTSSLSYPAFAVDSTYSNVLDDLNSDNTFNISDYPAKSDDYSLNVIQIAESSNKELFVYVYQPCNNSKRLTATTVRISTDIDNPHYVDYKLSLINFDGVFVKYKVEDLTLSENSIRYYEIVSIFRDWDKNIDLPSSSGNDISSVVFSVKQLWTVKNDNGSVSYDKTIFEVIEIDNKYVGFVRYSDGEFFLHREACDSHFVAFSTDINIDQLFEADVSFVAKSYKKNVAQIDYTNVENKDVTLTYKDKVNNSANGLFAKKYVWDRIQTVDDLLKQIVYQMKL